MRAFKTKATQVIKMKYKSSQYSIEKRLMKHPEDGELKRFFLIEHGIEGSKEIGHSEEFGECVFEMFRRERSKPQGLNLSGE